jgi:RND superfamily putative drug exporter
MTDLEEISVSETSTPKRTHRRFILLASIVAIFWLLVSGVTGPLFGNLSSVQKNDNSKFLPSNSESSKASGAILKFSTSTANNQFPTLVLFEGKVDQAKVISANAFVQSLMAKDLVDAKGQLIRDAKGNSISIPISAYLAKGAQVGAFPSAKNNAILANIPLDATLSQKSLPDKKPALLPIVTTIRYYATQYAAANGFVTHTTGLGGLFADLFNSFSGLDTSLLLVTFGVIALILIVVYRSPILWILPLLSAGFALTTAGGVIYELAKHNIITLDGQSQGILSVLVLGAATDYALLLIARYREELHNYEHRVDAMKVAWRGVVEPILASGSTVALGLLMLLLSQLTNNRGLGPIGAIGIVCAMITILTLLPALLLLFGRWIFWPKRPKFNTADEKLTGVWSKVAKSTENNPRKYLSISLLILVVLAAFSITLHSNGLSTAQSFTSRTDSVIGQEQLTTYFPGGQGQPTQIVVSADKAATLITQLQSFHGVSQVQPQTVSPIVASQMIPAVKVVGGKELLNVTLSYGPDSSAAVKLIPPLRTLVHGIDPTALVGGTSAVFNDIGSATRHDQKVIIPVILLLISIILALLLRSVIASLLLLLTVVISYLATLGVCAIVFHHIFHFAGEDSSFPLFAFVFLVALGIDYNIFLMTRVREESIKSGTRAGMTKGVTVTGGVITSAGIVLAATFSVLSILPLVFLAELGFAVAFGVLLDTMLVRSILVPALVHTVGPKVWWPSKLAHEAHD